MSAPVREIPPGSGINGRPILADKLRHLAVHNDGKWRTLCGMVVPQDHRCPPYYEIMAKPEEYLTCWRCDGIYRTQHGEWVPPGIEVPEQTKRPKTNHADRYAYKDTKSR
jgi:hypothetical protein